MFSHMNLGLIVNQYRVAVLLYFTLNVHQCKNHLHKRKRVIKIFGSQSRSQSIWEKHPTFCGLDILDKGDRAYLSGGVAIQNQLISINWGKLINWNFDWKLINWNFDWALCLIFFTQNFYRWENVSCKIQNPFCSKKNSVFFIRK